VYKRPLQLVHFGYMTTYNALANSLAMCLFMLPECAGTENAPA
jgi:hypothetical protein